MKHRFLSLVKMSCSNDFPFRIKNKHRYCMIAFNRLWFVLRSIKEKFLNLKTGFLICFFFVNLIFKIILEKNITKNG